MLKKCCYLSHEIWKQVVNFNGKTMITEKSNMIGLVDKKKQTIFSKNLIRFSINVTVRRAVV